MHNKAAFIIDLKVCKKDRLTKVVSKFAIQVKFFK